MDAVDSPADPEHFRPPRVRRALCRHRRRARRLVRAAEAARRPRRRPRSKGGSSTIRSARTSTMFRARKAAITFANYGRSPTRCRCCAPSSRPARTRSRRRISPCAAPAPSLPDASARIDKALELLARPDRRRSFGDWLRMLLEDMLVIDAATIYPRFARSGALYALDIVDGATIKPLIGEDGRAPEPPDPAYQQVLHGVPAADFSADELLYLPRNLRAHKALRHEPGRADRAHHQHRAEARRGDARLLPRRLLARRLRHRCPRNGPADQIRQFQDYFDALMSGNSPRRRMLKFMPADFRLIETRQPPLKDQYDEWLARVICYAFSVPASPFVSQVNRATSETMRLQATQEGLVPLKSWVKSALDQVIQVCMREPGSRIRLGRRRRDRPAAAGADAQHLGLGRDQDARGGAGGAGAGGEKGKAGLGKFNPYHDERGRFATTDGAAGSTVRSFGRQATASPSLTGRAPLRHQPGSSQSALRRASQSQLTNSATSSRHVIMTVTMARVLSELCAVQSAASQCVSRGRSNEKSRRRVHHDAHPAASA